MKTSEGSRLYTLLFALFPLIMMYKAPGISMGFTTLLVVILVPITLIYSLRSNTDRVVSLLLFALYLAYAITKSSIQNIILCSAIFIHIQAINKGLINTQYFRKFVETIAVISAICVTLQQVVHIVTGIHIPFIYGSLLLEALEEYRELVMLGVGKESMYRPSAFFLEPSHLAQYCILGLGSVLFARDVNYKKALIISLGLLMCTSGMGIVMTFAMWGWWNVSYKNGFSKKGIKKGLLGIIILVLVIIVLKDTSFIGGTISRITTTDETEYNAINGRLFYWEAYFGGAQWTDFLFGMGQEQLPDVYFTGFMKQIYAYGIIGFTFFASFIIYLIVKTNGLSRTIIVIYGGLIFFADLTGFIPIIFNIGSVIALYRNEIGNIKKINN